MSDRWDGGRQDVRVCAEVEEELEERKADDERRRAERVELPSKDGDYTDVLSTRRAYSQCSKDCHARKRAAMRKPWIWIHLRPSFSMVRMEA